MEPSVRFNARVCQETDSPIGLAYGLLGRRAGDRRLLDLAQAAPQYPAAPEVVAHVAAVARDVHGGDYAEPAGLPKLRESFAAELADAYRGSVRAGHVVVTAGCNQAFCLAVSALAGPGDEVVLVLPYYFNHDMWLRMNGIRPRYLEPGPDLLPSPAACERLINDRVRAVLLVTPGNPSGVVLPPGLIAEFAALADRHGIALILDETYRSFRGDTEPAHRLLCDRDLERGVVSLHSFSKDLALPGYRVGAVVGSSELNRQIMKLLDCVAICAPRIGQEAAWAGLTRAADWRARRAAEVAVKQARFEAVMADRPGGFELLSCGGFFGWVRHPFTGRATQDVVRDLVLRYDTLVIPGTAFLPEDRGTFRVSFSNVEEAAFADLAVRFGAAGRAVGAGRPGAGLSR
ncbi:aminotransferase [Streptomyces sp. NPDC091215]|uniref:aminotransferase n=1 Tax=Streptomyces sp. NPDC091215 TaxID=3155192 RepID=UPI00342CA977